MAGVKGSGRRPSVSTLFGCTEKPRLAAGLPKIELLVSGQITVNLTELFFQLGQPSVDA